MSMDELGIWDWMVRDDADVHALGTQLRTVASELRTARTELVSTLGSASTAMGWEGQITHRADLHTNPAASLVGRFIEDADAAGQALVALSQARDQHAPALRVLRQDWADLQANPPEEKIWIHTGGMPVTRVDHAEKHRLEEGIRADVRHHTDALSEADGTCQGLLAGAVSSLDALVPPGTSPSFLDSLLPQGTVGLFVGHGLADDEHEQQVAADLGPDASADEVRAALAGIPPARLASFLARHPDIADVLARDWDPDGPDDPALGGLLEARGELGEHGQSPESVAAVAAYWAGLSRLDRERMRLLFPTIVGSTDGVPLTDRAIANRWLVQTALRDEVAEYARLAVGLSTDEQLEAAVEALEPNFVLDLFWDREQTLRQGWWLVRGDTGQMVRRTEHNDLLLEESAQRMLLYQQMLEAPTVVLRPDLPGLPGDQRMVVLFDPRGDGRFAEYTGRLDAQNVSVIVPGTGTSMAGMQDYNERFSAIAGAHSADTAVITWLGGDMPDAIGADAPDNRYSIDNGHRLVSFVEGLGLAPERHVSLVGHSAGGAVVGFADLYGADVDSVLHVASAGTGEGVSDASMYPSTTWDAVTGREVERYAQTAPGDLIQVAQRSGEIRDALEGNDLGIPNLPEHIGHGYDPEETPGFTELETGVWLVDSQARGESFSAGETLEGVLAHDHVIRPGTTSWENIVAVIRSDEESMEEK